jgi:hypothetical protein
LWQRGIAHHIPQCLSVQLKKQISKFIIKTGIRGHRPLPFSFVLGKNFALSVVADDAHVDEAADIQLLRSEHRHVGGY